MLLRAKVLAKGFSGVRPETLDLLVAMLNRGVHPVDPVPGLGGRDRRPRAARAPRAGARGRRRRACSKGERRPSAEALAAAGLAPVALEAKEGLALINGTQLMTAIARPRAGRGAGASPARPTSSARSASTPSRAPTSPSTRASTPRGRIPGRRPPPRNLRQLLAGSAIRESHRDCGKVQDAYRLRCMPQVHGAARDALAYVAPRGRDRDERRHRQPAGLRATRGELLSGGNFHGQPVALAADVLAIAVAELGASASGASSSS